MNGLARFLFEIGHLKRVPRSGWALAGIDRPETVAEHSFRTAILGYVLAVLEGADPARTAMICLFHDAHEARIGDLHHLGQRYADWDTAQQQATADLLQQLPAALAEPISALIAEGDAHESPEARLAREADRLELLFQAIEYRAAGARTLDGWIERQAGLIETGTGRRLADECRRHGCHEWWTHFVNTSLPTPTEHAVDESAQS